MRLFLRVIQCNGWSEHPNEKATPNRNGAVEYVPLFHCPIVHGRDSHQYQYDSIFCTKCDQFPFIWIESNFSLFHFGSSSFFLKKNVAHNVFRFQFWLPLDPEKTEDFQSYSIALDRMKAKRGSIPMLISSWEDSIKTLSFSALHSSTGPNDHHFYSFILDDRIVCALDFYLGSHFIKFLILSILRDERWWYS